jgi:uncharacterized membrane protein
MPDPLHPAVVHFPIVLAFLAPLVIVAAMWIRWRGHATRTWWPVVLVWSTLAASAFVAVQTGERDEERVEEVVAEDQIEQHEEQAELFFWVVLALLAAVMAVPLVRAPSARRYVEAGALAAALAMAAWMVAIGHSGGVLVYESGAARAYTDPGVAGEATTGERHDDDDRR